MLCCARRMQPCIAVTPIVYMKIWQPLLKWAGSITSKLFISTQQLYNVKEIYCRVAAEKTVLEKDPQYYITEVHGGFGFLGYFKIPKQ